MKRGYKVSIGGSFFAGSGGGGKTQTQNERDNQQINQDTDDNDDLQPQPDMPDAELQQQQQKQPRMLARNNAPGIKDNKKVSGKQNQRDNHQMAEECKTKNKQDRKIGHATSQKAATDDGKHNGRNSSRTTRINNIKHNDARIITVSIANHITGNTTNKENQEARQSQRKPRRHQRTHATYRKNTDISRIGLIQEYEGGTEILVAVVTQENTSDDNASGKKQGSVEVCLEETRNNAAWVNQRKGCVNNRRKPRHEKGNRKSTSKQLTTHFLYRLEAPLYLSADKDTHFDISTIIIAIGLLHSWKPKQDSPTRPNQTHQGHETQQKRKGEHKPKQQKTELRQTTRLRPARRLQKGKMGSPKHAPPD
jgi:hypothetical protein